MDDTRPKEPVCKPGKSHYWLRIGSGDYDTYTEYRFYCTHCLSIINIRHDEAPIEESIENG